MSDRFQKASGYLRGGPVRCILEQEMDGQADYGLLSHLILAAEDMVRAHLGHGGRKDPDLGPIITHFSGKYGPIDRIRSRLVDAVDRSLKLDFV